MPSPGLWIPLTSNCCTLNLALLLRFSTFFFLLLLLRKVQVFSSFFKKLFYSTIVSVLNCDVGEDSWEPLGLQGDQPVHPKRNQSWVFIGRTDVEAETPILCWPDAKSWLIWKVPDAGKDWGLEEKGTTEDEMAGWHHQLIGHGFPRTQGVGDGQGGLASCNSWGCNELNTTE